MNDYTGKVCPYCKTAFAPEDDIIVCSACDMPHHKDCWIENQGCTTFGCLGTIKAADSEASSVTTTQMTYDDSKNTTATANNGVVFCTQCGSQNASTASFCSRCGNRLAAVPQRAPQPPVYTQANPVNSNPYSYVNQQATPYQQQSSYQFGGHSTYQAYQTPSIDPDMQQLVGPNSEYYIPKFLELKSEGKATSWNWPAFFFTPYWMMYRKMYGYAAAVLSADILVSLISLNSYSWFAVNALPFLSLGGYIVLGLFGNSIYMKFLEGKARQAKTTSEPYKSQFIASNSGVNTAAMVLSIIGRAIFAGILLA